ncbi:spore germination protein [Bacillus coahuilensis]|uniref:spore germination protein n=1 Tax=Bacillus coahuilensis TaxID=408580 RepID=UPI000A74E242|nr:spore germination protein [Bacillus coahuilensis]
MSEEVLTPLTNRVLDLSYKSLYSTLPVSNINVTNLIEEVLMGIIRGHVYLFIEGDPFGLLLDVADIKSRSIETAESESLVYGPKVSFNEKLENNMSLLRNRVNDPRLKMEKLEVGNRIKTIVYITYIQDIADPTNVETFRQRLNDIEVDSVIDSTLLAQQIEDNSWTLFPQYVVTELPDRVSLALLHGKIGLLVERSPAAVIGPSSFFSFFETTEDVYLRWNLGSFLRFIRMVAIFLSILLTPAYVAVLTYHYEVIPSSLLISLGSSRANVPFPPVMEALLLEFIIELLREAGARLPTKVGQTMGIVGGIVIGQAAVQAGFTSNILIIIIALGALGSFTTPSYVMGAVVRFIRFPIIILAGMFGGIGIMFAFCFLILHLLRLTTLGRPYLSPVYPFHLSDLKYSLFRVPPQFLTNRASSNKPIDSNRIVKKQKNNMLILMNKS